MNGSHKWVCRLLAHSHKWTCPPSDLQAAVSAISDWIVAVEAAGPNWEPAGTKLGQFLLLPATFSLDHGGLLLTLIRTATRYLDSQQKWTEFEVAEHGLHNLLRHVGACMRSTAKVLLDEEDHEKDIAIAAVEVESYFEMLSTASRSTSTLASCMSLA